MYWLKYDFKLACWNKGIHIMKDDLEYIEKQLSKMLPGHRQPIARLYISEWLSLKERGKSDNECRRHCNLWLKDSTKKL